MMNFFSSKTAQVAALLFLGACTQAADDATPPGSSSPTEFNFEQDLEGWKVDFADYPVGEEVRYGLNSRVEKLPASTGSTSGAVLVTGSNFSDDLFMFLKRQLTGLKPSTTYQVVIRLRMASQDAAQSVGIGGSPGASVYVKVGAAADEPVKVAQGGAYRLNLDKGNQAADGTQGVTVGTIGITGTGTSYKLIERDNASKPLLAKTDANGALWVFAGTDSGFEGTTAVYYDWVKVELSEK